jgi:hypothetical protein
MPIDSWSKYGSMYGSGQNYDEQNNDDDGNNNNNNNNKNSNNGCGGYGGENYWYMGRTQCFKSNVAYSLYGVLKGEKTHGDSPCHKDSYINSFFTTFGVESFTGPMGVYDDYDDVTSECNSQEPQGGGNNNNNNNNNNYNDVQVDDDYLDDNYQFYNYASYTSYGIGCAADSGRFVSDKYSGAFCHGSNYVATTDTLDAFNEAIEDIQCTQIYSRSDARQRRREQERSRQLAENNNNNNQENYKFEEMDAIKILSFSKSCSLRQYPNDCPDPYGLKKKYGTRINQALEYKTGKHRDALPRTIKALSWISLLAGAVLVVSALDIHAKSIIKNRRRAQRRAARINDSGKRKSDHRRRRSKSKSAKSARNDGNSNSKNSAVAISTGPEEEDGGSSRMTDSNSRMTESSTSRGSTKTGGLFSEIAAPTRWWNKANNKPTTTQSEHQLPLPPID